MENQVTTRQYYERLICILSDCTDKVKRKPLSHDWVLGVLGVYRFFPILGASLEEPLFNTRRYGPLRGLTSSSCEGLQPLTKSYLCILALFRQFFMFSNNLSK